MEYSCGSAEQQVKSYAVLTTAGATGRGMTCTASSHGQTRIVLR